MAGLRWWCILPTPQVITPISILAKIQVNPQILFGTFFNPPPPTVEPGSYFGDGFCGGAICRSPFRFIRLPFSSSTVATRVIAQRCPSWTPSTAPGVKWLWERYCADAGGLLGVCAAHLWEGDIIEASDGPQQEYRQFHCLDLNMVFRQVRSLGVLPDENLFLKTAHRSQCLTCGPLANTNQRLAFPQRKTMTKETSKTCV